MRALLAVAFALALGGAAAAQPVVTSAAPEGVTVTVYRDRPVDTAQLYRQIDYGFPQGLAMITETRRVTLPAGRSTVRFRGVAEGVLPQSAKVDGVDGVEQNFDFDLLSPGSLIARTVGEPVRRIRTNPETGAETVDRGVLRSAASGVVLEIEGRLEALGCSGLPERLVFDRIPANLAEEPTLSVVVDAQRAGPQTLRLSYLAYGLQWSADYVARVREDGRTLDLTGWITLANTGRTTFERAPTAVVAGEVNRRNEPPPQPRVFSAERRCWPMDTTTEGEIAEAIVVTGGRLSRAEAMFAPPPPPPAMVAEPAPPAPIAELSELGDYKLYTLPEPTTVAARQAKQVLFLDQKGATFDRRYRVDVVASGGQLHTPRQSARILLRLQNTTAAGLGRPLPSGRVVVMERTSDGSLALAGRPQVRDMPEGAPVELPLGRAFDVTADARLVSQEQTGDGRRYVLEVTVANAETTPAAVEIAHQTYGRAFRVVEQSGEHAVVEGRPVWTFPVPANGRAVVRYTIETAD
ncbi:MAG TPA: hypothetical protein VF699_10925 [Caulobacteraceae bacterium]|jgi:hypothetical protein